MKELLEVLFDKQELNQRQATELLTFLASGEASEAQIASVLAIYNMRPVSVEEVLGFREALMNVARPIEKLNLEAIDVCGTGGDSKDTFNISTTSSFVVAGAGVPVAKHGNYSVSSSCGSSNVLEALGIKFSENAQSLHTSITDKGICFLHAPLWHPAMKHVGPARKALGVKTFFNILGPLCNPLKPKYQVTGVYNLEILRLYEDVFQELNIKYAVIHALDGYDECSLTGKCMVRTWRGAEQIIAEDFGLASLNPSELKAAATIEENARIVENILQSKATEAQMNVVLANSAIALYVAEQAESIKDGVKIARESISSGKAFDILKAVSDI